MNWETVLAVAGVAIALLGGLIAFLTAIYFKLGSIDSSLKHLSGCIKDHAEEHDTLNEQIMKHETRISRLEGSSSVDAQSPPKQE